MMVCRIEGQNAETASGRPRMSDELSRNLNAFFRSGAEAIVFTNRAGLVKSASDGFLEMVEAADATDVKGRSFGDFMSRGGVDLRVLTENAARAGQMRSYATTMQGTFGAQVAAEVSVTYLADDTAPAYVFVIRDVSRSDTGRSGTASTASLTGPDESGRSVVDLVGAATLKNIVAETTDVIEKMCIETAVELTGNNRVAAAEMLGLSRQSLYVKLRKYGLL
jgi:transcriptional regulator PpsR